MIYHPGGGGGGGSRILLYLIHPLTGSQFSKAPPPLHTLMTTTDLHSVPPENHVIPPPPHPEAIIMAGSLSLYFTRLITATMLTKVPTSLLNSFSTK